MTNPIAGLDRLLGAVFDRHVDAPRHAALRDRYRATALTGEFATFLGRLYGLS